MTIILANLPFDNQQDVLSPARVFISNLQDNLQRNWKWDGKGLRPAFVSLSAFPMAIELITLDKLLKKEDALNANPQALLDLFFEIKNYLLQVAQRPENNAPWRFWKVKLAPSIRSFFKAQLNVANKTELAITQAANGPILYVPQNGKCGLLYGGYKTYQVYSPQNFLQWKSVVSAPEINIHQTIPQQLKTDGVSLCHVVLIKDTHAPRYWMFHISPQDTAYNPFNPQNGSNDLVMCLKTTDEVDVIIIQRTHSFNEATFRSEINAQVHSLKVIQYKDNEVGRLAVLYHMRDDRLEIALMDGQYNLLDVKINEKAFASMITVINLMEAVGIEPTSVNSPPSALHV